MNRFLYDRVIEWIPPASRVLDLGTGDGGFLERLIQAKRVHGEGVERDPEMVMRCIERGLEVHQGDILEGLDQYGANTFDFVMILGTFQELFSPREVLHEAFRVGSNVIIAYLNFGYWRFRSQMLVKGKTPRMQSSALPWYESPNIQFFSIFDFYEFCEATGIRIKQTAYFSPRNEIRVLPNFRAEQALALISPSGSRSD